MTRSPGSWDRWNRGKSRTGCDKPVQECEFIGICKDTFPKWFKDCVDKDFKKNICTVRGEIKEMNE